MGKRRDERRSLSTLGEIVFMSLHRFATASVALLVRPLPFEPPARRQAEAYYRAPLGRCLRGGVRKLPYDGATVGGEEGPQGSAAGSC